MIVPEELKINEEAALSYTIGWVRDYFKPLKGRKAVIGLSGGSDSTFTAYACQKALGGRNVLGVIMPADSTPPDDVKDAEELADLLGIDTVRIDIMPILEKVESADPEISLEKHRIAKANIKARIRMLLLYKEANKLDGIVAGTDDRSEHDLGYYTKYGDGGVDINVPEHLYKTELRQILLYIGRKEKMPLFERVAEKTPSPGLWNGQTAENELDMRYEDIDRILYRINEKHMDSLDGISRETGIKPGCIEKVFRMIDGNGHKGILPPSPPIKYFK